MRILCLCVTLLCLANQLASPSSAQQRPKIVGGETARIADWPGFAALALHSTSARTTLYFCGGTVVAATWVLTAGHCLHDHANSLEGAIRTADGTKHSAGLFVTPAVQDLKHVDDTDRIRIKRVIIHPTYAAKLTAAKAIKDVKERNRALKDLAIDHGHDLALLELETPWQGQRARLSLQSVADPRDGTRVRVAGFGYTDFTIKTGLALYAAREGGDLYAGSDLLLQAALEVIPTADCRSHYGNAEIGAAQVCAGLTMGGRDSCSGDSGGPLVAYDRNRRPYQVGLVSWGKVLCGQGKAFGVYTRISAFADWIQTHTGPLAGPDVSDITHQPTTALIGSQMEEAVGQLQGALRGARPVAVEVRGSRPIRLGGEFQFAIRSPVNGRLLIFDFNADRKVTLLFPNRFTTGRNLGEIQADEELVIPGPGYGFDAFRAQKPIGDGRLLALVVPADFDIESTGLTDTIKSEIAARGFAPVKHPTSYFMRFILQIERALAGGRTPGNASEHWGFSTVDYEIKN